MKFSCCSTEKNCCENPALGLGILRLGVVILFLVPGIIKLMNPGIILNMIQNVVGIPGILGVIMAWLVIITEVGGGIAVLLGKIVPKLIYKISLVGFFVILLVAMATIHIPAIKANPMGVLSHILMLCSVLCLMFTRPMCPSGICGDK